MEKETYKETLETIEKALSTMDRANQINLLLVMAAAKGKEEGMSMEELSNKVIYACILGLDY